MGNEKSNRSIECSIDECAHHCNCECYCSLDKIKIGTHEANPTKIPCTDCQSFKMK